MGLDVAEEARALAVDRQLGRDDDLQVAEHHLGLEVGDAGGEAGLAEVQLHVAEGGAHLDLRRYRPAPPALDVAEHRADPLGRRAEGGVDGERGQRRGGRAGGERLEVGGDGVDLGDAGGGVHPGQTALELVDADQVGDEAVAQPLDGLLAPVAHGNE